LSFSPTFYEQLFQRIPFAKKIQIQTVSREKASKTKAQKSCLLNVGEIHISCLV